MNLIRFFSWLHSFFYLDAISFQKLIVCFQGTYVLVAVQFFISKVFCLWARGKVIHFLAKDVEWENVEFVSPAFISLFVVPFSAVTSYYVLFFTVSHWFLHALLYCLLILRCLKFSVCTKCIYYLRFWSPNSWEKKFLNCFILLLIIKQIVMCFVECLNLRLL